jgi:nucleotide-binding universal stress UspA family protein
VGSAVVERVEVGGGIVVGYDGSEYSREAIRWGVAEGRLRACPVHVVRAWQISTAPMPASHRPGFVPSLAEYEGAVLDDLRADITRHCGDTSDVDVRAHAVHRASTRALLEASADADLLVVGSRGAGGFAGLLLGSTSDQIVRHARCPVVVVRAGRADG